MRSLILCLSLFVTCYCNASEDGILGNDRFRKGGELLLTFVVHRHGDRTPVQDSSILSLSDDPERDIKLSFPYGEGGLTNEGKRRGYSIGEYLRDRYDSLLSNIYFYDEIYLRSTDIERTKMTILAALAAMYPPVKIQRWSKNFDWQPIPYTTLPQDKDFMTFFYGCPKASEMMNALYGTSLTEVNEQFPELLELLSNNLSYNFTENSSKVYLYNDLLNSQAAIGVPPPKWIAPHLDELYAAASLAIRTIYKNEIVIRLAGGVFLHEFFRAADAIIAGEDVKQRVRIYSAHDINVVSQLAAGHLPVIAPKYGSILSFELYRIKKTGKYFVLPVFLPQAGVSHARVLPIEGCGYFCEYKKYRALSAPYTLSEQQQLSECNA